MRRWSLVGLLTLAWWLSGCAGNGTPEARPPEHTPEREPPSAVPAASQQPRPAAETPTPARAAVGLVRSTVYLDAVEVVQEEGRPWLLLSGQLPTPCHRLQTVVQPPDAERRIRVQVFSVVERGQVCVEVLAPFQERVALSEGPLPAGTYQVLVNEGEPLTLVVP